MSAVAESQPKSIVCVVDDVVAFLTKPFDDEVMNGY